jgi:hypothetical protein
MAVSSTLYMYRVFWYFCNYWIDVDQRYLEQRTNAHENNRVFFCMAYGCFPVHMGCSRTK